MRRWLSRLAAGLAASCLVLAAVGPAGAQGDTPARPDVFRSSAASLVAQAFLDRDALLPVPEAFRFIALDGDGTYESSNQTARASILYPGNGVIRGPNLACGSFGEQFPEQFAPIIDACLGFEYPLTVFADSLEPSGETPGGQQLGGSDDPLSAEAVRAAASATDEAATTDAALADLTARGLPELGELDLPGPLTDGVTLDDRVLAIEHATSRTDQRIDGQGRLVVEAESVLDGVHLVGGLIEIESIRSTTRIVDDGHGERTQVADLAVGGVTVGGFPAELTEDGLVVGEPTGAGPLVEEVVGLVRELVDGLDVRVSLLDAERGTGDDGVAFARVGGILVEFGIDVQGLPVVPGPVGDLDPNGIYQGVIQLGSAGVTGTASHIDVPPFVPAETPTGAASPAPSAPVDPPPTSAAADPPAAPGGADERAGAVASTTPTTDRVLVTSVAELWADRLRLVYLAFTLIGLAVCLAPRFVLPSRLPGGSS